MYEIRQDGPGSRVEDMRGRVWLPVGVAVVSGLVLFGAAWPAGLVAAVPLAVTVAAVAGVLAGWPRARRWLPWAAGLAAVVSLAATVVTLFVPYEGSAYAGLLGLGEAAGLLALLALVVRTAPARLAWWQGVLLTVTDLAYLLRVPPPPTLAAGMATLMVWFAGPVTALIAGGYPRLAEARRRRSVDDARRMQRLQLARDLHDFVAHDLTGIVVQAQAAQHVGQTDPAVALTALQRIEAAGLHALASMDEALDILRDGDGHTVHRGGTTAQDVAKLVESFTVTGGPTVDAHIDEEAWNLLPPESAAMGYRVVGVALTNVRRHAPETRCVQVSLRTESDRIAMTVTNELPRSATDAQPSRGGRGLSELVELVRAGGGQLTAAPVGEAWRLRLTLPPRHEAGEP